MKRLNNKGITLVELVISIGIFALIMVAVFNILTVATRSYNKNTTEVSVQNEAQSLMGHLENIISGASVDIAKYDQFLLICYEQYYSVLYYSPTAKELYFYVADGSTDSAITASDEYKAKDKTEKWPQACVEFMASFAAGNVYNPSVGATTTKKAMYLLAENVSEFTITDVNLEYNYLGVSFTITDGEKSGTGATSFTASKNIKIRNNLAARTGVSPSGGGSSGGSGGGDPAAEESTAAAAEETTVSSGEVVTPGESEETTTAAEVTTPVVVEPTTAAPSGGAKTKTYEIVIDNIQPAVKYNNNWKFNDSWTNPKHTKGQFSVSVSGPTISGSNATFKVTVSGPSDTWNDQIILYFYQNEWNPDTARYLSVNG